MNSASQVSGLISAWKAAGMSKSEIVVRTAEACLGWSYVWGALGEECTVDKREYYMNRSAIGEGDKALIKKRCQVLNGSASACNGCKYFPNNQRTRIFDCRGFTRWTLQQVGITIQGAGATSQYNTNSNWTEKGLISNMPRGKVCCVFKQNGDKMEHTGLYLENGKIIHCSVEVKESTPEDKGWKWSHYAVPYGLDGDPPISLPTLRRGDRGEYVTLAQTKLIQKGYSCGTKGADGIFGKATENATKSFQKDSGLVADGIIGQRTWNALLSTEPAILYTVIVKHLTEAQANTLVSQYPGAEKQVERG